MKKNGRELGFSIQCVDFFSLRRTNKAVVFLFFFTVNTDMMR